MALWTSWFLGFYVLAAIPPASTRSEFQKWAVIRSATSEPAQPIGTYAAGCLAGAVRVAQDGVGYALMRPSRRRAFAHPMLRSYLENLGTRVENEHLPLLLVGDISPPRGGPMRSGHSSHQIGLDVDLWLKMGDKRPGRIQRETWSAPSFVRSRKTLKKNWSQTQVQLISLAADHPDVNRIFVSPTIKRYLCEHQAQAPWLYKIRAWWGHEEHIHVRLNCPANSPACESQAALDTTQNGCGEELSWWFSKEADEEWQKIRQTKEREFPSLPEACQKLAAQR